MVEAKQPPLDVRIPKSEPPAGWSRVGIVAAVGFVVGVAWPKLAGVQIGPSVPADARRDEAAQAASAEASSAPSAAPSSAPSAAPAPSTSAAAGDPKGPARQQLVVVGPGTIIRCSDSKKDKKIDDCGALQVDNLAKPRLEALAKCSAAIGLSGKVVLGVELNFERKEANISRPKKTPVPSSTVQGIIGCAAKEFASLPFDEIPHKYKRYTLSYNLTFVPPGKEAPASADGGEEGEAKGKTTSETDAAGSASVAWDTALMRSEPKEGKVVARLVRGTKVKLAGKQNDWYRVEHGSKTGWIYRGALGL